MVTKCTVRIVALLPHSSVTFSICFIWNSVNIKGKVNALTIRKKTCILSSKLFLCFKSRLIYVRPWDASNWRIIKSLPQNYCTTTIPKFTQISLVYVAPFYIFSTPICFKITQFYLIMFMTIRYKINKTEKHNF